MSTVDVNVPRFNQAVTAVLCALVFVLASPGLVAIPLALLVLSRLGGPAVAPITQLYVRIVRPRFLPDGPVVFEDARPPAFAQLLGIVFLGAASLAFIVGLTPVGMGLTLLVAALAALAATARICVGCLLYARFVTDPT